MAIGRHLDVAAEVRALTHGQIVRENVAENSRVSTKIRTGRIDDVATQFSQHH